MRALREDQGLTQQEVSERTGLAITTLRRVERGEDTRLGTLAAIAGALGTTAAELLDEGASVPVPPAGGEAA